MRRWVPELAAPARRSGSTQPWQAPAAVLERAGVRLGETYPCPIVDHGEARRRALAAFDVVKGRRAAEAHASRSDRGQQRPPSYDPAAYPSVTMRGSGRPSTTSIRAAVRGSEKRCLPAEPGFRKSVAPRHSIAGRWLWPLTTTSTPSATGS